MIERKFVAQKFKEFQIQEYIEENLQNVGHSHTKMVKTPLGEKIIIYASRPGLIVGRKGQNIKELTKNLKKRFDLENPQIEISEVENPNLDVNIVAERITDALERFGSQKFKAVGHKAMEDVMIKYDGTCRNSNNRVIQFVYGDNGIDTTKQTEHTLTIIRMSNTDIKNTFGFSDEELKKHKWNEKDQAK